MSDFEKLGVLYLGRRYDLANRRREAESLLYDSKDLVTHAVCVGMTGSGKTGLCLGLLEECAIDGIPAIIIDPKGDLANLLLTFPDLSAGDFRPWINPDDAARKGRTPDQFAADTAEKWKAGLAEWGQDGARVRRLRDAADAVVYTPGSSAGLPVSILKRLDAPPAAVREDAELFRERVASTASSLLGLVGIAADPLRSREHVLISSLLSSAWARGASLDLAALVQQIQQPPISRIGVMEIEGFFPAEDRFGLAMALNNVLAAPGFEAWTQGQDLDLAEILRTPAGKPRLAIFSIAHLGDAERMFFVTQLLSAVLGWARQQPGTSSLRAVVYMDEIAGYCPPSANPPSKQPLLTLMKQGRAFGVGVVLATQNPVDLDYKGLSNAGTWFIGRLQTERDKLRVLDGLEGAAAAQSVGFDRAAIETALSALSARVFLLNNVHEDRPEFFETRWCLSYLAGPMTREQIRRVMEPLKVKLSAESAESGGSGGRRATSPPPDAGSATGIAGAKVAARAPGVAGGVGSETAGVAVRPGGAAAGGGAGAVAGVDGALSQPPVLPPGVPQYFLPIREGGAARVIYRPRLLGLASVFFSDTRAGTELELPFAHLAELSSGPIAVDWSAAEATELHESDLESAAPTAAGLVLFAPLPAEAGKAKSFDGWKRDYADAVFRTAKLELLRCESLGEVSKPKESERDFRARLSHAAREERDELVATIRGKYAPKFATLDERLRKAQQRVEVQQAQSRDAKLSTAVSIGSALLGALFGRKTLSASNIGRASSAARAVSRAGREAGDVGRAEEDVAAVQARIAELDAQVQEEISTAQSNADPLTEPLETVTLRPKRTNIRVKLVALVWLPHGVDGQNNETPLW